MDKLVQVVQIPPRMFRGGNVLNFAVSIGVAKGVKRHVLALPINAKGYRSFPGCWGGTRSLHAA